MRNKYFLFALVMLFIFNCSDNSTNPDTESLLGTWLSPIPQNIDDEDNVIEVTFKKNKHFIWKDIDYDWDESTNSWIYDDEVFTDHPDNRYSVDEPYIKFTEGESHAELTIYFTEQDNDHRTFYYGEVFSGTSNNIVGTWQYSREKIDIDEGGTYTELTIVIFTSEGEYFKNQYSDDELDYSEGPYTYVISGDTLVIIEDFYSYETYIYRIDNSKLYLFDHIYKMTRQ